MVATFKKILIDGDAAALSTDIPQAVVEGSSGSAGSASTASKADHVHPRTAYKLNEFVAPSGAVNFNGKEATGLCLDNQAGDPAAVLGKVYFKTGDTHAYLCTDV
jgi:hypothetical protein